MPLRNVLVLLVCRLISATGSIVLVTLGGIIGSKLTENQTLATLPVSIMVVCVAATTIPATILMKQIGRKLGFALASLSSAVAVLLAAYALQVGSFPMFSAAAGVFGINLAFTQQYRFAAAESVDPGFAARAISFVLLGPIGGALVGPELIKYGQFFYPSVEYAGTLTALAVLYLVQASLFLILGPMRGEDADSRQMPQRSISQICRQPVFLVAVLAGMTAYGVMTMIMTAAPISMHLNDGYSLERTAQIIRNHVLAMYVPALFSGFLIERLGTVRMMSIGALALIVACVIGMHGRTYLHYWNTLVLLGVGWNFLYVGGTTMLTLTYSIAERFRAQAINEFAVFGTSAAGSLLAGTVIHLYGWYTLMLVSLPLIMLVLGGLFLVRSNALVGRRARKRA